MNNFTIPSGVRRSYEQTIYRQLVDDLKREMKPARFKVGDSVMFPKEQKSYRGGWEIWYPHLFPQMDLTKPYRIKKIYATDILLHETLFYRNCNVSKIRECKTVDSVRSCMRRLAGENLLYWVVELEDVPFFYGYAEDIFV